MQTARTSTRKTKKKTAKSAAARPAARARTEVPGRKRYALTSVGPLEQVKGWSSLNEKLGLKAMGITIAEFPAGQGYEHPHFHAEQEELYLVARGRGQMAIDGEVIELKEGDLVRVDPPAKRAIRSHPSSPSLWVMVGATPGMYREDDYTELKDEPAGF